MYEKPIIELGTAMIGPIKFQSLMGFEFGLPTVRKPLVKCTNYDLPKSQIQCHKKDNECHENDLYVTDDTGGFRK